MRLTSSTVTNYRSIRGASKVPISDYTVLVGPNNRGKSNLISATSTALLALNLHNEFLQTDGNVIKLSRMSIARRINFDWEKDFPLELQSSEPNGKSQIRLEFQLNSDEINQFRSEIKSNLNGTLPITIQLGRNTLEYTVNKRGRGQPALNSKSDQIANFVSKRFDFVSIPAVRTAETATDVVQILLQRELQTLDEDARYQGALRLLDDMQKPILEELSKSIASTLQEFLPEIRNVKISADTELRRRFLHRGVTFMVDDGRSTPLVNKGDGVQSLVAMALMRHAGQSGASGKNLVVAIEEPESHLHPGAMQALKSVIKNFSSNYQVIVTTHNPIFVDRLQLENNIIVNDNAARQARKISDLRDVLGVAPSDNLRNAKLILLVEGSSDRSAVRSLLCHYSEACKNAIASGFLVIESMNGATNLGAYATLYKAWLCDVHALLDHDVAGQSAAKSAIAQNIVSDSDINYTKCLGVPETEIEDLYDPNLYLPELNDRFKIALEVPFSGARGKWSNRIRTAFMVCGRDWSDPFEATVKQTVAELVASHPEAALMEGRKPAFNGLIGSLEQRLKKLPH